MVALDSLPPQAWSAGALALALLALLLTVVLLRRQSAFAVAVELLPGRLAEEQRAERERARSVQDEAARALREEIGAGQTRFHAAVVSSFRALADQTGAPLRDFKAELGRGIGAIDGRAEAIRLKLDADMAGLGEASERGREALRTLVEGKLDHSAMRLSETAQTLRDELGGNFHRLGGNMTDALNTLGTQQKERLEALERALETLTGKQEAAQAELKRTVEARLDQLRTENGAKLDEMRQTVDEKLQTTLESRLGESFNRVVEQLERVHAGIGEMRHLASNVGDLKNVLTNVKVRGSYGEVQLALLLEDMLSPEQYARDVSVRPGTLERVEFAVRMPRRGGELEEVLPIDAKFPREDYERLLAAAEAGQTADVAEHRKALIKVVRKCARDICDKYIHPPHTTPFAIMFLPSEGLYAEVLREPGLHEQIQREHRVTLAGPTNLTAFLSALQMGMRSLAIEQRSSEVWKVLGAVRREFQNYNAVVERLGKQLDTAARSVDALGTRTRVMQRTLKGVDQIGGQAIAESLLGLEAAEAGTEGDAEPTFRAAAE